jgi:rod shape-determining protein MreD
LGYSKSAPYWQFSYRLVIYTFSLLLVQALWVSQLPYPPLRADLLLPLMLGIALEWSPLPGFFWAFLWGFVMDTFSGRFWGLHVGSYVVVVCLVHIASERLELYNPVYQMAFVGLCALGQSVVLCTFLMLEPSGTLTLEATWIGILIRALFIMLLTPFILFPIWHTKKPR